MTTDARCNRRGMPFRESTAQRTAQAAAIDAARKLLEPSPVKLHHCPRWFKTRLTTYLKKKKMTRGGLVSYYAFAEKLNAVMDKASDDADDADDLHVSHDMWLDHWGSTTLADGRSAFVSEPYDLSPQRAVLLQRLAEAMGLEFWISPNSWWYPGATIRLIFAEPKTNEKETS